MIAITITKSKQSGVKVVNGSKPKRKMPSRAPFNISHVSPPLLDIYFSNILR